MKTLFFCLAAALAAPSALAQDVGTLGPAKVSAEEAKLIAGLQPEAAHSPQVLEQLVRRELVQRALVNEAAAQGWDQRPDVAERARLARESAIASSWLDSVAAVPADYPAESDIKAFYESNRAQLRVPKRYRVAQIFVRRPPKAEDAKAAQERAAALAKRVAGGEDFAALARSASDDAASRDKGGELGWIAETALLPQIRSAVQTLQPGAASGAIESNGGWHIVRVLETRAPSPATYDEAKPSITQTLRQRKAAELRNAHIDALLKSSPPVLDQASLSALAK